MRKATKRNLGFAAIVLSIVLIAGFLMNLYGVFNKKEVNPDNLVSIDATLVEDYAPAEGNLGHGWSLSVGKLGELKIRGKATGDYAYKICDFGVPANGTYTLTSGLPFASEEGVCIYVASGASRWYGDFDGSFTLAAGTTYSLYLFVAEGQTVLNTVRPVLVSGTASGSFYQK